jgi:hypothetical protein
MRHTNDPVLEVRLRILTWGKQAGLLIAVCMAFQGAGGDLATKADIP